MIRCWKAWVSRSVNRTKREILLSSSRALHTAPVRASISPLEGKGEPPAKSGARLADLLRRKVRTTRAATPYELKNKLIRYGLAQGYDYEAVRDAADALIATTDDSCDTFF